MSHRADPQVSHLIRSQVQEPYRSRDILAGSRGRRHAATEWLNQASTPTTMLPRHCGLLSGAIAPAPETMKTA
jgi:hypothetical protein